MSLMVPVAPTPSWLQIDVMVLYTFEMAESRTKDAMETYVAMNIASTNEAMMNSDIPLQMSLVHVGLVREIDNISFSKEDGSCYYVLATDHIPC